MRVCLLSDKNFHHGLDVLLELWSVDGNVEGSGGWLLVLLWAVEQGQGAGSGEIPCWGHLKSVR